MKREIVLDTETTGLDPKKGHRIIEIGAIELVSHLPTGNSFHTYINPNFEVSEGAYQVHGISNKDLEDKPLFSEIVEDFLMFIGNSNLIIHNAPFDMGFLNTELNLVNKLNLQSERVIDTLKIAKSKFPGSSVSLDSLCKRFNVDNSSRTLHGALLDAEILSEVYLELMGGKQPNLQLLTRGAKSSIEPTGIILNTVGRTTPLKNRITESDKENHRQFVKLTKSDKYWGYN